MNMKSTTTTYFTAFLVTATILSTPIGVRAADEELLFADIPMVYSASKHEEPVSTTAAAVYVLTAEDIRRSGMTSIPELLRMVPGLDVARVDANHWAISARGFNNENANKLLVLIDGRTVYGPFFGGVFWNVQDLPLEEIDRIEVIRGPGATLWGANAVNGVINIITKEAKDTQGMFASVTYGSEERPMSAIRYGGKLGTNLFYRTYVKYFDRQRFVNPSGGAEADSWDAISGGFRIDWHANEINNLTLQGDGYRSRAGETIDEASLIAPFSREIDTVSHNTGDNILGRWTHSFSKTSELTLQMYYDHVQEEEFLTTTSNDTYDFDLLHRFSFGDNQEIAWGFGYRYLTGYANSNSVDRERARR
jgi:iron complex outermembrane recepter protein